jgi:RNA polymerase-binding transcription factor DksA
MNVSNQYEQLLQARARDLRHEISEVSQRAGADRRDLAAETVHDTKDQSTLQSLEESAAADISRDMNELRDVEAALERLHSGQYGICTDCGATITAARIAAYPTAKRCLQCQQQHERRQAG